MILFKFPDFTSNDLLKVLKCDDCIEAREGRLDVKGQCSNGDEITLGINANLSEGAYADGEFLFNKVQEGGWRCCLDMLNICHRLCPEKIEEGKYLDNDSNCQIRFF